MKGMVVNERGCLYHIYIFCLYGIQQRCLIRNKSKTIFFIKKTQCVRYQMSKLGGIMTWKMGKKIKGNKFCLQNYFPSNF